MSKKEYYGYRRNPFYRFIRFMVWVFYPKTKVIGAENLPQEGCVIVGNHCKANGPIISQLYMPRESYTWCVANMMHIKEVPSYSYTDFWSKKPKWTHFFYHIASYVIAPIGSFVMSRADTIPVYRDKRVLNTFKISVEKMQAGADVVIFPECYDEHNNIVHDFQRGFVDVARIDYKKTGRKTPFVPMYTCPGLRMAVLGKPIYYDPTVPAKEESENICNQLMDAISEIAYGLPRHKVVPYVNVKKKFYGENIRETVSNDNLGNKQE